MKIVYYHQIYDKLINPQNVTFPDDRFIPIDILIDEKENFKIYKWYYQKKELRYSIIPSHWKKYYHRKDRICIFFIQHVFQQIEDIIYVQY